MGITTMITLDPRGRTSLGKLTEHRLFTAHVEDSGRIILEPAVVVSAQTLYEANPEARETIARGGQGAATVRPRPSRS